MKRRGPGRGRSSEDARFLYLQQISCGTEARGGEPAGYMGSSNCPSNLPDCWFSDMEQGFLQLTALSPCFLWNQQAPGGRSWSWRLSQERSLGRTSAGRNCVHLKRIQKGDSPRRKRSDSDITRQPLELKLKDLKPSCGEDENGHR